jgi:hypothetical protein
VSTYLAGETNDLSCCLAGCSTGRIQGIVTSFGAQSTFFPRVERENPRNCPVIQRLNRLYSYLAGEPRYLSCHLAGCRVVLAFSGRNPTYCPVIWRANRIDHRLERGMTIANATFTLGGGSLPSRVRAVLARQVRPWLNAEASTP